MEFWAVKITAKLTTLLIDILKCSKINMSVISSNTCHRWIISQTRRNGAFFSVSFNNFSK